MIANLLDGLGCKIKTKNTFLNIYQKSSFKYSKTDDGFKHMKLNSKCEHATRILLKTVLRMAEMVEHKGLPTRCHYAFDLRHKTFFLSLM